MADIKSTVRNSKLPDLTGRRFHRLTVVAFAELRRGRRFWLCSCSCGGSVTTSTTRLASGNTKSCGCWGREVLARPKSHGKKWTPEYRVWCHIKQRCGNKKSKSYPDYGGRGIVICEQWRNSFGAFLADVGPRPSPRDTIERINVNGGYEPGNVRWATRKEQNRNTRRNRVFEIDGVSKSLAEWCELRGANYSTVLYRIAQLGWDVERALAAPLLHRTEYAKPRRGEDSPVVKLTADRVRQIRASLASGEPQRAVADRHGVSRRLVQFIAQGKRWNHLT